MLIGDWLGLLLVGHLRADCVVWSGCLVGEFVFCGTCFFDLLLSLGVYRMLRVCCCFLSACLLLFALLVLLCIVSFVCCCAVLCCR